MAQETSKSVFFFNCFSLYNEYTDYPGVKNWNITRDIWAKNSAILDRTGHIQIPVRHKILDWLKMPEFQQTSETFEQICLERANDILINARIYDKEIAIMWSGGIDSTCVLASFLSVCGHDDLKRIVVLLDRNSQTEHWRFYNNFIKNKLRVAPSNMFENYINDKTIFVTGEGGDQVATSDFNAVVASEFGPDGINLPATADNVINAWATRTSLDNAKYIYSVFEPMLKASPFELNTLFQNFWYINFNIKWQTVYIRLLASMSRATSSRITEDYLRNNYLMFYGTNKFQHWVASNWHLAPTTWADNKLHLRTVILKFDNDEQYFYNKRKIGSLFNIVATKTWQGYITDEFKIVEKLDSDEYLQPKNSFV